MEALQLTIISPDKILYQGSVETVVLPGTMGYFGILAGHVNLVAGLDVGVLTAKTGSGEFQIAIDGGFCEVKKDHIRVLTEGGESVENISRQHAEELLAEAEKLPLGNDRDFQIKRAKSRILLYQN